MKKILLLSVSLFSGLLLYSCAEKEPAGTSGPNIRDLRVAEKQVISSSNQFCFDYFKLLSANEEAQNVTFSPFSAHAALSMLLNGADGVTKQEIKDALRVASLSDSAINISFKSLKEYLLQVDKNIALNIANSVWYRQELHVKDAFVSVLKSYYDAEVTSLDFENANSVKTINNWVSKQTAGRIPTIIDKLKAEDVMILLNAVYFKSDWKTKFDKLKTQKANFYQDNGTTIQVDMMQSEKMEAWLYYDNTAQFVDIPFGNGGYAFTVIMPGNNQTLDQFIGGFSNDKLQNILANKPKTTTEPTFISLKMPRFRFAYEKEMNDLLKEMGMKNVFTDSAELPHLFEEPLDLYVSQVKQKTFVQIDENGGEAAAVTSVIVGTTSVGPGFITVDRPFMFLIREINSNTILFIGKVHQPKFE